MRIIIVTVLACLSCRKEPPPPPTPVAPPKPMVAPLEVTRAGAYHAVQCGDVTAVFSGSADDLKELATEGRPVPKSYGVKGLSFVFADGRQHPFTPSGELAFSDWSFDVFSPDCSHVSLLQDRFGPFVVLATKDLPTFANPRLVKAEGQEASVHGQWRWTGPSSFEFVASCCGGAKVLSGELSKPGLVTVFDAPSAPQGLTRGPKGWQAK